MLRSVAAGPTQRWYNFGRKVNDRARQSVLCTALDPFGKDPEEESRNFDYSVPQRQYYEAHRKRNQDAVFFIKDCQEHRIKDCDSGRQKSFAIITHTTGPGDCIDRVTSQNGN